ncbi:tyrosine-type recombinase/integrase [Maribacter sp. 2-571]|uniref:tyrosine-type recombinase/integrase n=1 Tax=Maribacter sp. 2-571 TaxID=3417569 RepID=UPI003D34AA42
MALTPFMDYLSLEKKYSPHTVQAYGNDISAFAKYCEEAFELDRIEDIAYSLIRSWIVVLVDSGMSNRSVNRKVASLKAYYRFLLREGEISINPLAKHVALKTGKKVEVPFSEKEMEAVLQLPPFEEGFEGVRDKLMITLLYTTGIRRAELIALEFKDVDLGEKTIRVLGKRNKERIVPLLDSTVPLFFEYIKLRNALTEIADDAHIFLTKAGRKIYETLVYRTINRYFSEVSTKVKKSPHILRHTFATHLLNKGADLNSVKELLGHASLASTQVYTHNSIAELKKVHALAHPRNKR